MTFAASKQFGVVVAKITTRLEGVLIAAAGSIPDVAVRTQLRHAAENGKIEFDWEYRHIVFLTETICRRSAP
jgi:hypothetical protein